uniref:JMY/WHAMM middle domain-containing protein n=1 Tax=Romanomermis culicivorax TaxID=13658 RepID=A0A915L8M1_ROMCU
MIDSSIKRDADDDEWLAVKADVFKNDSNPCISGASSSSFKKRQPNFHVNWNENEQKFCLTFNENSRVKSDTKQKCSFSSSFSVDQLIYVHKNLAYIVPELADDDSECGDSTKKFYDFFPEFPRSTWSEYFLAKIVAKPVGSLQLYLLFTSTDLRELHMSKQLLSNYLRSVQEARTEISDWRSYMYYFARASCPTNLMDKLCLKLENYFAYAYQKCSHFAFMSTLFPENFGVDEYFENLSELRHKTYSENLEKSVANFHFLLENRRKTIALSKASKNLDSNLELNERFFFDELDSSVEEILNLLAEYYTYLREPFLDLREIARAQIDFWKRTLEEDFDVGDRVKLTAKEKLAAKRQDYKDCAENLQELQLQYYTETKKLLFEYLSALKAEKFRNRSKSSARNIDPNVAQFLTIKIFDLEKRVAFADLNFCACQLWPIRQKRKTILNRIARLDVSSPNLNNILKNLEQEFFETQKDYYSAEIQILSTQDKYIRFQLNEIRRNTNIPSNTGETDEDGDTFFDAPDSEREMRKFLDKYSCDQPKIHSLKCRMDHVNRQLAILRNKKKKFEEKINEGRGAILSSLAPIATLGNCDLKSLLENGNNKSICQSTERLKLDRRTTIERIRSYRALFQRNMALRKINH